MGQMIETRNKRIAKEYQIPASTSASAAQLLVFPPSLNDNVGTTRQVILAAKGADITFKFGTSGVTASATASSNVLPDGNFTLLSGAIYALELNADQTYVSVITATGTGTAIIQLTTISA